MEQVKKTLKELYEEEEHSLDQFAFVIFIANPMNKTVKVIVDDGFVQMTMQITRFVGIIEKVCGYKEAEKIRLRCTEYGVPYMYDREKMSVVQLRETPAPDRITAKKLKDENYKDENAPVQITTEDIYESLGDKLDKRNSLDRFLDRFKSKQSEMRVN